MRGIRRGIGKLMVLLCCPAVSLACDGHGVIPFRLIRGYTVVVNGSIGKLRHLNFVIDTGAVPTVVDKRIARKLHLSGSAQGLSLFNGTIKGQRVTLPGLQIGPIQVSMLPVLLEDLSLIKQGLGIRIDALVGLDALGQGAFSLNYESREMIFGPRDFAGSSAQMEPGLPYAVVHLEASGRPFRMIVDTGSRDTVLFEHRVQGRIPGLRTTGQKVSNNLGGEVRLSQVEVPAIHLGDTYLHNFSACVMPTRRDPGVNFDGLMGFVSLGAKEVQFDFEHNVISWR